MQPVVARIRRDLVRVEGPDALTWLQGQLSQDVAGLPVGASAPSFVLAPQGKVDGWGRLTRVADDAVEIDVDPGAGPAWVARLERFKLRTRAEVTLRADVGAVAVRGAAAPPGARPASWPGDEGGDVVDPVDADAVVANAVAAGAVEIDPDAFEARRIRAGVPRWGTELDPDTIPATVGQWAIDASVSFTKGCYTGQELVARIDSRGGNVPRHLVVATLDGPAPVPGAPVVVGGETVGAVTSAAVDAEGAVAQAFVTRKVELADGAAVAAEVDGRPARLHLAPPA